MNRNRMIQALIKNAQFISKTYRETIENWPGLVKAKVGNQRLFIPGYIPYIGVDYCGVNPKILIYALSQNLSPSDDIAIQWGKAWQNGDQNNEAIDRQNINFRRSGKIMMHPFDTGHLPIIAGITYYLLTRRKTLDIFKLIAATNLSKFSFRDGNKTTDNFTSLKKCFEWFSIKEINILQPDCIICAGDTVFNIVKDGLENTIAHNTFIIRVDFPSLQVINSRFKKFKKYDDKIIKTILSIFSNSVLNKESSYKNKKTIREIIERDSSYFISMFNSIKKQIETT